MNQVTLIGRITKDLQMEKAGAHNVLKFSIAINKGKDKQAIFIECQAWNKTAELIEQYFARGNRIGIIGNLDVSEYENKKGIKVHKVFVNVEKIEFIETRKTEQHQEKQKDVEEEEDDGFNTGPLLDISSDDLPF